MKTYSYSQIWRIAYPILISMLMEQLVGMTDAAFLGRVGEMNREQGRFPVDNGNGSLHTGPPVRTDDPQRHHRLTGSGNSRQRLSSLARTGIFLCLCNGHVQSFLCGKLGPPAFGIAGAAMGSTLAEGVSLLFFIIYTRLRIDYRKYGLHQLPHFRLNLLGNILGMC